jgi:hypothetical protein
MRRTHETIRGVGQDGIFMISTGHSENGILSVFCPGNFIKTGVFEAWGLVEGCLYDNGLVRGYQTFQHGFPPLLWYLPNIFCSEA